MKTFFTNYQLNILIFVFFLKFQVCLQKVIIMLQSIFIISIWLTIMGGNVFCTNIGPLKPLHLESINDEQPEIFNPFIMKNINVQELDTDEPYLWQMAAYAARQMTNKQIKYKMITLNSAEKIDSIYRLRISLKRIHLNSQEKSVSRQKFHKIFKILPMLDDSILIKLFS